MQTEKVFPFLRDISEHNAREWFHRNKSRYDLARSEFSRLVETAIVEIGQFDPTILHLTAADCMFRFYRDIRFSPDKSPYKRHFGAYICRWGRKSLCGGYYIHIQPENSFVAVGAYCLPTNVITACRNEIVANFSRWQECVENDKFVSLFGRAGENEGMGAYSEQVPPYGFGSTGYLRRVPRDFPDSPELSPYLRMKDFSCWRKVPDDSFADEGWIAPTMEIFRQAKPMMDFINDVVVDYV